MTTNDNDMKDGELKAYLEGEDGLSATYRQAGNDMPPPALDTRILRAAHVAVQEPAADRRSTWRGAYQLAASFVVGILVASLYLERPDELARVQEFAIPVNVSFSPQQPPAPSPAADNAPAAENGLAGERAPAGNAPSADIVSAGENAPAAERASAAENEAAVESPPAVENGALTDNVPASERANGEKAGSEVAPAPESLLPLVEQARVGTIVTGDSGGGDNTLTSSDVPAPPPAGPVFEQQSADIADDTNLEEIMVTGSRIVREPVFSYRENRNTWQAEIRRIIEELAAVAAELETLTARLEEERALFLQAYPDATPAELSVEPEGTQ